MKSIESHRLRFLYLPTRASEAEAVGKIALESSPELLALLFRNEFGLIVVALELLVAFGKIFLPIVARAAAAASVTTAVELCALS